MDKVLKKSALITAFREDREALVACTRRWPGAREGDIFLGEWSVLDLLAHMSGWDEAYLEAITALHNGRLPEFYAHKDADWRSFNAHLVMVYRRPTLAQQIALVQKTLGSVLAILSNMGTDEFFRDSGVRYRGYKVIVARLVESDLKDERVHLQQMQAWLTPS